MNSSLLNLTPAEFCDRFDACPEGRAFAVSCRDMREVWERCPRPAWLFFIVKKLELPVEDSTWRLLACEYVRETPVDGGRTVWDVLTDERSRRAVETAERHARGEASDDELAAAREGAYTAAYAAAAAAASAAASWAAAAALAEASAERASLAASAAWAAEASAEAAQAAIFRRFIPNPFQEV